MKLLIAIAFLAVANGMPDAVRLPEPALPQFETSSPVKEAVRVVDVPEISEKSFPQVVNADAVADEGSIDNVKIAPSDLESLRLAIKENIRDFLQVKYNKPYLRSDVPQMEVLNVKEAVKVVDAPEISDAPIEAVNVVNAFEGIPEEAVKSMPVVNPEAVRVVDVAVEDSINKIKIVETPLGTIKLAPSELESIRVVLPDNIRNLAMNADQNLR